MSKNEILEIIQKNKSLLSQYGVKTLALFGSHARGHQSQNSDIDFLVEFHQKTFDAYIGLKEDLEKILGAKVDLVLKNTIKPRILAHIQRDLIDAA